MPSVTFRDLQQRPPGFGQAFARHALAELGALEITDVPGLAAVRRTALEGAGRCLQTGGLVRELPDGSIRRSAAARTGPSGLLGPLDSQGHVDAPCLAEWRGAADHLRLLVRAAALQALSVLHSAGNAAEKALATAEALEHFHVYSPSNMTRSRTIGERKGDGDVAALPLHVDAGYAIAATAGLLLDADGPAAGPLLLRRGDGELVRPRLRAGAVLLLVGDALARVSPGAARAAPHALRLEGVPGARAWYGMMLLPPELLLNSSAPGGGVDAVAVSELRSLACRGAVAAGASGAPFAAPEDLADACAEGEQWCWMQCMPVPDDCGSGVGLTCTNIRTREPWDGVQMCPMCFLECPAMENASSSQDRFCMEPGMDMYMNGFRFSGNPDDGCLIYLFPSLVLNTPRKFWAAVVFTFLLAGLGPESLRRLHHQATVRCSCKDRDQDCNVPSIWERITKALVVRATGVLCVSHAYFIMLISMTFSLELFFAVVLGLACGHASRSGSQDSGATVQTLCCRVNSAMQSEATSPQKSPVERKSPTSPFPRGAGHSPRKLRALSRAELSVRGMTCSSCTGAVERCLRTMAGVDAVTVSLEQGRATVDFDPSAVSAAELCESVDDIGFATSLLQEQPSAAVAPDDEQDDDDDGWQCAVLSIGGMTCTTCSGAVERCLRALGGVETAEVALLQERATVVFDPRRIAAKALAEVVEDIGFEAVVLQVDAAPPRAEEGEVPGIAALPSTRSVGSEADGRRRRTAGQRSAAVQVASSGILHLAGSASLEELQRAGGTGFTGAQRVPAGGQPDLLRVLYDPRKVGARALLARLRTAGCDVGLPERPPPQGIFAEGAHAEQHEQQISAALRSMGAPASAAVLVLVAVMAPPRSLMFVTSVLDTQTFHMGMLVFIAVVAAWSSFLSPAGRFFLDSASKALQHGSFTMDVLVAASATVTSSYGLGLVALCAVDGPNGQEVTELQMNAAHFLAMAPVLLLVVLLGKKLELRARQRTTAALRDLLAAQPTTALARPPDGKSSFQEMPLDLLELGDHCRVTAGARFPAEGVVLEGSGAADESLVTGEAAPVRKAAGAAPGSSAACCLAGSTLAHGDVVIQITAVGPATTLGRLTALVAHAQGSKPQVQRFADELAARFVPAVLALTACTVVVWLALLFSGEMRHAPHDVALKVCIALQFGLAVMMLACPCAMGLATPTAISVAVGVASSRHHCLVRDASVLERGASRGRSTAVVLDKTGTITEGRPEVVAAALWAVAAPRGPALAAPGEVVPAPGAMRPEWLQGEGSDAAAAARALWVALGAAEAAGPQHPVASAIDRFCESQVPGARGVAEVPPGSLEHLPGRGLRACVQLSPGSPAVLVHAGGLAMLGDLEREQPAADWPWLRRWAEQQGGATLVFAAMDGGAVAVAMALRDPVRAEAPAAAEALVKAYGGRRLCELWVCTGDNAAAAALAASALGVPASRTRAGQRPEDKRELVCQLQSRGCEVLMVGDGLNDAPALAQADLGVAIGAGADLACDAAGVVLCRSSLLDLLAFRELCLATRRTIFRNFAWAFGFNLVGLPLAAGCGYPWGVSISPMLAGMAMACSSLLVVSSSLMLQRFRPSMKGLPGGRLSGRQGGQVADTLGEPLLAAP